MRKLLLGTALIASLSSTALGVTVETLYALIENGPADFGAGAHTSGRPEDYAVVSWDYDTSSGQLVATGRVRGTLYWDDLFRSGCARLTLRFRDQNHANLALRNIDRCGPGANANSSANQIQVDESFASPNLHYIRITTSEVQNGQPVGRVLFGDAFS